MKYDVITIGGATEDITFYTSEGRLIANRKDILRQKLLAFEYGAKIKISSSHSTFGGGAANAAVSLSRLGFKVAGLIAVGDDTRGEKVIKNLKSQKVDTSLTQIIKNTETGFSFLLVGNDNEHIVFSNRGANSELDITNHELQNFKNAKWLYVTSLSGDWKKSIAKIFSFKGPKIAWNPGHIQLKSGVGAIGGYLKKVEVLIINKDEAIELTASTKECKNKSRDFFNNIVNLLEAIKITGPKIVVITNGRHGAYAYDGNKIYRQKIIKEFKRVNTTGVGDAFGSSFIAGLELYGGNITRAMRLAAHNSASVVGKLGAQNGLLHKKDIKKI